MAAAASPAQVQMPVHQQPWLQTLMSKKPELIVSDWIQHYYAMEEEQANPSTLVESTIESGSKKTISRKSSTGYYERMWTLDYEPTKKRFYVGRGPKTTEIADFYGTFTKLGVSMVINFSRLHEGPLPPGGAVDFNDALYFPCTPGEIAHFAVQAGDAKAEVAVTNARVTMINDVVAISDLDVEVNVDIKQTVVGDCHTIEPRQTSVLQHIQHFNWPPSDPPWCTDSVLQTLATLERYHESSENKDKIMCVMLLCADGCTRSGAFLALFYCIASITQANQTIPFDLIALVKDAVKLVRTKNSDCMRNERIFVWLNYAVVEHCIKHLVESGTGGKKTSKRACEFLSKLRKTVYQLERKSITSSLSLMA